MSSDLLEAFGNPPEQPLAVPPQQKKPASKNNTFSFEAFQASEAAKPRGPKGPTFEPGKKILEALQQYEAEAPFEEVVEEYDEEEDFGDFEDAPQHIPAPPQNTSVSPAATKVVAPSSQYGSDLLDLALQSSTSQYQGASGIQQSYAPSQASRSPWDDASQPISSKAVNRPAPLSQARLERIAPDPDVLFDATQLDDGDDDFGDFEDGVAFPPELPAAPVAPSSDLLGLDSSMNELTFGMHTKTKASPPSSVMITELSSAPVNKDVRRNESQSQQKRRLLASNTQAKASQSTAKRKTQSKTSAASKESEPKSTNDEGWDDFADWEPSPGPTKPAKEEQDPAVSSITSSIKPALGSETAIDSLPPTNVPPPAVLLSIFPPLFADTQAKLFKPLAAQPYQLKNRLLSDPVVGEFLRGYLLLATVAARIIAGRKSRWKRDNHLSQGMRIGPASSRGTSGMKLTGVDKSETAREDRETLDVVQAWREQLGRLRSAVAGVNSVNPAVYLSSVPEIQETIPVRIANDSEGGVTAPHQCALCGLKRNERVVKVDLDVDDSFGEWWIEKTSMHRACRNFWEKHQETLRQR